MRVKLTGIVEIQTEIEAEIDDEEFLAWYQKERPLIYLVEFEDLPNDVKSLWIVRYLEEYSDDASEIWATAPQDLNDYEVLTADFVEAEVLDAREN